MKARLAGGVLTVLVVVLASCKPEAAGDASAPETPGALVSVGSIHVSEADLIHHLKESHGGRDDAETRTRALEELTLRARLTQAALDAGLDHDPAVRAEMGRILAQRYREEFLAPRLKEIATQPIAEDRLRELYEANESRFRSNEKRRIAVLWLDAGGDPERAGEYLEKLNSAREWVLTHDLKDHPEQGFSVLGVDHSEHQASRYKGGVVGWMESTGGIDAWSQAVAEIAFSLQQPGEVSEVVNRPEGLFLVRFMAVKPAFLRPVESVAGELETAERQLLRDELESTLLEELTDRYPPR